MCESGFRWCVWLGRLMLFVACVSCLVGTAATGQEPAPPGPAQELRLPPLPPEPPRQPEPAPPWTPADVPPRPGAGPLDLPPLEPMPGQRELEPVQRPSAEEFARAMAAAVVDGKVVDQGEFRLDAYLAAPPAEQQQLKASLAEATDRLRQANDQLEQLRRQLVQTRQQLVEELPDVGGGNETRTAALLDAIERLLRSELDATERHTERLAIRRRHVKQVEQLEERTRVAFRAGVVKQADVLRASAARLDMQIGLHLEPSPLIREEELALRLEQVEAFQRLYDMVHAAWQQGFRGGGANDLWPTAALLAAARARFEMGRGDYPQALTYQRAACVAGTRAVEAARTAWEMGMITLDKVVQAQIKQGELLHTLDRWQRRFGPEADAGDGGQSERPVQP